MALEPTIEGLERDADARPSVAVQRCGPARLVLEGMRPSQWIKNAFVLAGVIFAGDVLHPSAVAAALAVTAAFCLASGATYLLNDVRDAESDRLSPRTATRPIARGALSPERALGAAAVAAGAALGLAGLVNDGAVAVVAAYLGLQVAYTWRLKHVAFVDVLAIAVGFVLRAAAGGVGVDVPVSSWLLLATGSLALFLGFGKRRGELAACESGPRLLRPVMARYTPTVLDRVIDAVTGLTIVVYVAYAALGAPSRWLLLTIPLVAFGLFRVRADLRRDPSATEDPALYVLRDRIVLACVTLWAMSSAVIIVITGG